jgi:hypothetical protein
VKKEEIGEKKRRDGEKGDRGYTAESKRAVRYRNMED